MIRWEKIAAGHYEGTGLRCNSFFTIRKNPRCWTVHEKGVFMGYFLTLREAKEACQEKIVPFVIEIRYGEDFVDGQWKEIPRKGVRFVARVLDSTLFRHIPSGDCGNHGDVWRAIRDLTTKCRRQYQYGDFQDGQLQLARVDNLRNNFLTTDSLTGFFQALEEDIEDDLTRMAMADFLEDGNLNELAQAIRWQVSTKRRPMMRTDHTIVDHFGRDAPLLPLSYYWRSGSSSPVVSEGDCCNEIPESVFDNLDKFDPCLSDGSLGRYNRLYHTVREAETALHMATAQAIRSG